MTQFYVYMLECNDGSFYVGSTNNFEKRVKEHNEKKYGGYTSTRLPIKLVFVEQYESRQEALTAEKAIKG